MGGGGIIAVALEKLKDVPPQHLGIGAAVGLPQDGEQGPGKPVAQLHLRAEERGELPLVHFQHLQQGGHLHRDPLLHAGGDHPALEGAQHLGHGLGQAGSFAHALEEGEEIGIVAQRPAGGIAGVLPLRPVVGPGDPGGVRRVLQPGVVGDGGHVPVDVVGVVPWNCVGYAQQIWHWRHSISILLGCRQASAGPGLCPGYPGAGGGRRKVDG